MSEDLSKSFLFEAAKTLEGFFSFRCVPKAAYINKDIEEAALKAIKMNEG